MLKTSRVVAIVVKIKNKNKLSFGFLLTAKAILII
tara:strand:- start:3064 stop:3168 length:105 start_codon:yes stop_codon:yes gene_type:complete